jgi:CheY-like chemotaxis protein
MAKVMLVEDDNNLREIYEARLQAEGYTIVSAKDGEEALVIAKAEKPDLVISDVMMPKISGFEMLDILRNTDGLKDVKVIMLTALGQSDDQQRADKLGADRYLVKSQVTLEDIVKTARDLLESGSSPAAPVGTDNPGPTPPSDPPVTPPSEPPVSDPPATPPTDAPAEPPASTDASPATALPSDSPASSTADEEAAVEAKIEDFVAGATTEAAAPDPNAPAPEPSTEPAAEAPAAEVPAPEPEAKKTDDDAPEVISPTEEKSPEIDVPGSEAKPENDNVTIAHKKVIKPIDSPSKTDINTLAAMEEAKEVSKNPTPAAGPAVIGGDNQKPQDPGSIAL